jgi:hypothetical protein
MVLLLLLLVGKVGLPPLWIEAIQRAGGEPPFLTLRRSDLNFISQLNEQSHR